jgi:hypothetical protein
VSFRATRAPRAGDGVGVGGKQHLHGLIGDEFAGIAGSDRFSPDNGLMTTLGSWHPTPGVLEEERWSPVLGGLRAHRDVAPAVSVPLQKRPSDLGWPQERAAEDDGLGGLPALIRRRVHIVASFRIRHSGQPSPALCRAVCRLTGARLRLAGRHDMKRERVPLARQR